MTAKVDLPFNFTPRPYQLPLLRAIDNGVKRAVYVSHRRSGKDKTAVNIIAKKMMERVGTYWAVMPELKQGRKIIWDGIDSDGFPFIKHFPDALIESKNASEMKIKYKNGSVFQVIGDDNIDSNIGSNPIFSWFDEYSLQKPRGWGLISPILEQNGGVGMFTYTPRGENHAFTLYNYAKEQPDWYCGLFTVADTGVFSMDQLERIRREYIALYGDDSLFFQEYWCDFSVPIQGAYYSAQIAKAITEGRITRVAHDPTYPVETYWDIGRSDYTAVWFIQRIGTDIRIIDYLETTGVGIHEIAPMVLSRGKTRDNAKGYVFSRHVAPHDINQGEWGSPDKSRKDTAAKLGIRFEVAQMLSIQDGIDSVRSLFDRIWIDDVKCSDGINALKNYRKQFDEKRKCYLNAPFHDWSSHAADALRTMGVSIDSRAQAVQGDAYDREPRKADYPFNPATV